MNKLFVLLTLTFTLSGPAFVEAASLELRPNRLNLNSGKQHTLNLNLNPEGVRVIGVDIFLKFDPQNIKIISISNSRVFANNPATFIDNNQGTAKFSLVNNINTFQTTSANIADVTIESLRDFSNSSLEFTFTPGSTTDTNVVNANGSDVLTQVTHLSINPSSPGSSANSTNTTSGVLGTTTAPTSAPTGTVPANFQPTSALPDSLPGADREPDQIRKNVLGDVSDLNPARVGQKDRNPLLLYTGLIFVVLGLGLIIAALKSKLISAHRQNTQQSYPPTA